nr:hypothetical protein [uncultured Draconibacterium sp.]
MFAKLLLPISGQQTALWFFVLPLRTFQLKEKSNVLFVSVGVRWTSGLFCIVPVITDSFGFCAVGFSCGCFITCIMQLSLGHKFFGVFFCQRGAWENCKKHDEKFVQKGWKSWSGD